LKAAPLVYFGLFVSLYAHLCIQSSSYKPPGLLHDYKSNFLPNSNNYTYSLASPPFEILINKI